MSQIRITPQELRDGSAHIKSIAENIRGDLADLKGKVDSVASNWEGAAQSSFLQSFEEAFKLFNDQFPPAIEGIATQMESAANTMEETDSALSQAFSG